MSSPIPNLWSPLIRPKVLSPRTILRAQALELPKMTGGLLEADIVESQVTKEGAEEVRTVLSFDIVAPSLNYRHRILSLAYEKDMPYPVFVEAEALGFRSSIFLRAFLNASLAPGERINRADSDEALVLLLKKVFTSSEVLGITQSIIARATDTIEMADLEEQSSIADAERSEGSADAGPGVAGPDEE
jgi:hypothetical protein